MYVETELLEKGILLDNINIIKNLINQHFIPSDGEIKNSITYLKQLFEDYNITNIYFDTTLARGLDYYTGIIFEINIDGFSSSVGGGGRYDNIITSYNNKLNIPMIGISFGLDRLLNFVPLQNKIKPTIAICNINQNTTENDIQKLHKFKPFKI